MVDENLTDEQQADVVRRWMKENGTFILGGVVLGLAALFGWNQYQAYLDNQRVQASEIYYALVDATNQSRADDAEELLNQLESNYSGTPYLDQARLVLAKLHVEKSDFEKAGQYLERVSAASSSDILAAVARSRLARVRLHLDQYDAALAAVGEFDPNSAFAPRFHEIRGDILAAMGRTSDARDEYQAALAADDAGLIDRAFVQAKHDRLAPPAGSESGTAG